MIKANELRIGNWLLYDNYENAEQYVQVKRIFGNGFYAEADHVFPTEYECENFISPIPLTPEILEKAGFRKTTAEMWGKVTYNDIYEWDGAQLYYGYHGESEFVREAELGYLHQLQNLYFALTGEELPISL